MRPIFISRIERNNDKSNPYYKSRENCRVSQTLLLRIREKL